ncbi:MAG: hypothetical protein H2172_02120 [Opitutus sp.]|nr:hypothetical protein [Opitutus sp.]MCS6247235.1 hypothetical protein [Opitutus sp.]MCS6273669.1 hypothetical protein [Opitutus sp.]MCS6278162.1 hypothetical protein [Opitutus sp.]MCS6299272.1 hypothetical protein [Opitutus sp.]
MSSHSANDSAQTHDAQLLARVAQGEQTALGELYDRWSLPLQALAAPVLKDPAQLEDVLHNTFITLWEKAGDFDPTQGSAYDWAATWVRANSVPANAGPDAATAARPQLTPSLDLAPPSAALRARILNSAVPLPAEVRHLLPFPTPPAWLGWGFAAVFSLAAIFFAAKSFNVRNELQAALESERMARLEAGTLKNLLEAERILSRAQLERLLAADRLNAELRAQVNRGAQPAPR